MTGLVLKADSIPRQSPKKSYKAINKKKVIGRYEVKASPKKPPRPSRRSSRHLRSPSLRRNKKSEPGTPKSARKIPMRSLSRGRSTSKDNVNIHGKMQSRTIDAERVLLRNLQKEGLHVTRLKTNFNPITGHGKPPP